MAVTILDIGYTPAAGIEYTVTTDTSADFSAVTIGTYLLNFGDNLVYYKDSLGNTNPISFGVASSFSATTLSGGTIYSGGTDLYDIFLTTADGNDITRVQGGTNISTGGTANEPIVNLDDNISLGSVNATTLTGGTIYSGGTDLSSLFAPAGSDTNNYVTGFTYDNANALTISVNDGNDYTAVINEMTGLTIGGDLTVNGQSVFSGDTDVVTIYGSGTTAPVFSIKGSSGELFSINDSLIGDIFSVNDISGIPILTVNSDEVVTVDGALVMNTEVTSGLTSGATTCATIDSTLGSGAYFDYHLMSGETMRIGTVMTVWNSTSVQYTDSSTPDLGGDTSVVAFSASTSGSITSLIAVVDSGTWVVKTGTRII